MKIISLEDIERNKYTKDEIKKFFDKTVVIPTETVYGLAGRTDNDKILKDIFQIKRRPSNNPLIVHISNRNMLKTIVKGEIPNEYNILMDKFWPGPLSLIFEASQNVSSVVKGNSMSTVAIRMPNKPGLLKLMDILNTPLAAPSANTSGQPSPTQIEHVVNDLGEKVETYIDGGKCELGLESTVFMHFENKNYILRPGSITKEEIEEVLQQPVEYKTKASGDVVVCPGTKYTHYSPKVPVYLFVGDKFVSSFKKQMEENATKKIGVMIETNKFESIRKFVDEDSVFLLGKNLKECASNCFSGLRHLENKVDMIFVCGFGYKNEGAAIMDRLEKASTKIFE